jgi:exoenzyme U
VTTVTAKRRACADKAPTINRHEFLGETAMAATLESPGPGASSTQRPIARVAESAMSQSTDPGLRDKWVARVLGINVARIAVPAASQYAAPSAQSSLLAQASAQAGHANPVTLPLTAQPKQIFGGANGRQIGIARAADGSVALTTPQPPLREITFSGGGGKGAALPGAIDALQPVLKDVKVVKGASVGSMTAALIAAGVAAEDFKALGNDPATTAAIQEGRSLPGAVLGGMVGRVVSEKLNMGLEGTGLQDLVRKEMGKAVQKQIAAFRESPAAQSADPQTLADIEAISAKIEKGEQGVTFRDLRTLSKAIPAIKEVEISATMIGDGTDGKVEKGKPQLAIFNADTEPDMEVALAARASASLPPVFKPVNIKLSSGIEGRFEDGGVMNNAPAGNTVDAERNVDPIPDAGRMTFVFEEASSTQIVDGKATPVLGKVNDFFAAAPNSAAEYAKNRALADAPEDVVVVPLKFTDPASGKKKDFSTFLGGTVNFNIAANDKMTLQKMTESATAAHLAKTQLPQTREFASVGQMLDCIGRDDLVTLANNGFDGAEEELAFRDEAVTIIAKLVAMEPSGKDQFTAGPVQTLLRQLDTLAGTSTDRQGFVAREFNRSGTLDPLLEAAAKGGTQNLGVLAAGVAVAECLKAQDHAQFILRETIYPKMVQYKQDSAAGILLQQVDAILRAARMPSDVNDALTIAIDYFKDKTGVLDLDHNRAFTAELQTYLMPADSQAPTRTGGSLAA